MMKKLSLIFTLILLLAACSKSAVKPDITKGNCPPSEQATALPEPAQTPEPAASKPAQIAEYSLLKPSNWAAIAELKNDDLTAAWPAWLQSCQALKNKAKWQTVCANAYALSAPNQAQMLQFFNDNFDIYTANNADGSDNGLMTSYYAPLLQGSRTRTSQYNYPIYKQPDDLITVELADVFPELKYKRLRGKLQGNKLVPYYTRAQIDAATPPLAGNEIAWVANSVELFFLQIQGSGYIQLDNGEKMHLGYADQNGHAYNSIGRILIERGELTKDQASMQGIKNWAQKNPQKLQNLLNENPSYVFFRELPNDLSGPLGALGTPLTAARSVAIDAKLIPLGAPVFLSTTEPNSSKPLKRLMLAQDTGGAIKGGVRADLYWGAGADAGKKAGSMKQNGKIWVLLPKGFFDKP